MKVTLIQCDLIWEDRENNLNKFSAMLSGLQNKTDLVALPEMFTTGFSMNALSLAEPFPGPTFKWMKEASEKGNFGICGSYITESEGKYYNRLLFFKPDGEFMYYDKRHLFVMGGEDKVFNAGKERVIVNYLGLRFNLQICYDLRFPVWSRNRNDYDVLLYVANWPEIRRDAWLTLLKARAIENQCFVIGVSRVGEDGTGIQHKGDSMVIDPMGKVVSYIDPDIEGQITYEISLFDMKEFRAGFPVWKDADDFVINHSIIQNNCRMNSSATGSIFNMMSATGPGCNNQRIFRCISNKGE
jgi:omega-amidase